MLRSYVADQSPSDMVSSVPDAYQHGTNGTLTFLKRSVAYSSTLQLLNLFRKSVCVCVFVFDVTVCECTGVCMCALYICVRVCCMFVHARV